MILGSCLIDVTLFTFNTLQLYRFHTILIVLKRGERKVVTEGVQRVGLEHMLL
jgi:hypothetical protein